jgi:endothelin-converting enzyme
MIRDQLQNPIELYNPMSISEIQQKYGIIDWNIFLRHFTPNDASVPERVIVTAPRFMQALTKWLANSATSEDGITTRTILDYFTIKTILANISNLDKDTREVHRAMVGSISSGTTAPPPRERVCVTATSKAFGQLLGRYFVIKSFGGEPQREQAARFMDNIQGAWSERLNAIDWLDGETRSRALEKVKKIGHKEAYSTITPDVRSPDSLFSYYASINVNPAGYYSNQKSASQWGLKQEWDQVGKISDKNVWYMDPHEVNAYYTPTFNEIVIPAGILQNPFYHSDLPQYLNYGGIGVVIGHEITVRSMYLIFHYTRYLFSLYIACF